MIVHLRGKLIEKTPPFLTVEVHGVGYQCQAPLSTFFQLPDIASDVLLLTHFIVREDAHLLFAFATSQERMLFQEIIKINGVGPKVALAILSGLTVEEFVSCIASGAVKRLSALPGIGTKTAERMILDLKDKLPKMALGAFSQVALESSSPESDVLEQAISALIALGYKQHEATKAVQKVTAPYTSCQQIIKDALQGLSKL